jgi:hypothetical protein
MFLLDMVVAIVIGLVLIALASALFDYRGPWSTFWSLLLIIVLATWAGGVWLTPFGPTWFGVTWLPFLFTGLLIIVLLAAATGTPRYGRSRYVVAEEAAAEATALSVFFWIVLVALLAGILLAYV